MDKAQNPSECLQKLAGVGLMSRLLAQAGRQRLQQKAEARDSSKYQQGLDSKAPQEEAQWRLVKRGQQQGGPEAPAKAPKERQPFLLSRYA